MPILSAIKNEKSFLWNWDTSQLLCAFNFPEGESGGKKGDVVKGPFPAILIGSDTNPFSVFSLPEKNILCLMWRI